MSSYGGSQYGNITVFGDPCSWYDVPCRAKEWWTSEPGTSSAPMRPEDILFEPGQVIVENGGPRKPFPWWLVIVGAVGAGLLVASQTARGRKLMRNPRQKASQAPWWAAIAIGFALLLFPEPITTVTGAGILATAAGSKLLR